jgi:hypothetical protein
MNVEANVPSQNWEKLLLEIHEGLGLGGRIDVDLSNSQADLYDFANAILMRRMRERLVEALQRTARTGMVEFETLFFGNKFFMNMNEQQQQSFFHGIFNLPIWSILVGVATDNRTESPAITINTSALLETLPQLHTDVRHLAVSNFALTRQSDVQELSNSILAKCKTLETLELKSIECPVDDCNKEDNDISDGFLDPVVYAASGFLNFSLSTKTRSVHSTVVSPRALRALIVEGKQFHRLRLSNLGLTDSHVLAIVVGLSTPGARLHCLKLDSNPGISAQGYGALFNLINQADLVGHFGITAQQAVFCVDDKAWEGKLNLVSEMNTKYCRLKYLTNGNFASEELRLQWLEKVQWLDKVAADFAIYVDNDDSRKKRDARLLNFIWYTLRQNPEMMLISQAPTRMTRTRKRKAT